MFSLKTIICLLIIQLFFLPKLNAKEEKALIVVMASEKTGDDVLLRNVRICQNDTDLVISLAPEKMHMLRIPPGDYYVCIFNTWWNNGEVTRFSKPEKMIKVRSERINFLGEIVISTPRNTAKAYYNTLPSAEVMQLAFSSNKEIFDGKPIFFVAPGIEAEIELDASAFKVP
jgi:hypothetical protein